MYKERERESPERSPFSLSAPPPSRGLPLTLARRADTTTTTTTTTTATTTTTTTTTTTKQ